MLKLFVCYNLGMIINIDDLDFNDPDERRVILEHRKKKREENLALKKSVNNGYLKGQRGVRLYYDYDKIEVLPGFGENQSFTFESIKQIVFQARV